MSRCGVEAERRLTIAHSQGAESSVIAKGFPDTLNTISPGHHVFGPCPINDERAETLGFRKALRALRARLIHIGRRQAGDDLAGSGPGGLAIDAAVGTILFGMDNGYRMTPGGKMGHMLCHGQAPGAQLGDTVTIADGDGTQSIAAETVAAELGAPSAAYWMTGLRNMPFRVDRPD